MFREGSDYMPFYADLGIPSMDFRYTFDKVSMKHLHYQSFSKLFKLDDRRASRIFRGQVSKL